METADKMASIFACQKCRKPLKIIERKGLRESTLASLSSDYTPHLDKDHKEKELNAIKLLGESFVVLPDEKTPSFLKTLGLNGPHNNSTNFHSQVQALTKIFEVVSDKCQIDCPLCDKCNSDIIKQLKDKVKELEAECKCFSNSINTLKQQERASNSQTEKEKQEQERERKLAKQVELQLEEIKRERELLRAETSKLEEESKRLDDFEKQFWSEYQDVQLQLSVLQEEQGAVRQKVTITGQQLEQLKRTNVYDDAFHISSSGHFGSINGFKLGRLQAQMVPWDENNAALGQVVLLLHSIAKQVKYEFKSIILHPMGSYSKIASRKQPGVLNELYHFSQSEYFLRQGSSSSSAGKRFKTALCLLLMAVKELGNYGASKDGTFSLPKKILGDTVGGLSIQAVVAETNWTKALKYVLTDLKYLLAWCSKFSASGFKILNKDSTR